MATTNTDEPKFDAATQQYKPAEPAKAPSAVALDAPARPNRAAAGKPSRAQFPAGMQGMREYQAAVADHTRKQSGGVDRGKEQREALL